MTPDGGPAGAGSLRLLGANRPFRLLWTARTVSFAGDSLGLVALMLHVAETTGQALAVALLLLAGDFVRRCSARWPARWPTGRTAGGSWSAASSSSRSW